MLELLDSLGVQANTRSRRAPCVLHRGTEDGSIERVQVARKVAPVCDDYRTKRSVLPLVEEMLRPLNNGHYTPESTMTLERFVETIYLPHVAERKRPSTFRGYRDIWEDHLKARCGSVRLREFHTSTGEQLLADIAHSNDLSRTMLKHIKSVLSGVFKHARRLGGAPHGQPDAGRFDPEGARGSRDTVLHLGGGHTDALRPA